MTYVGLGERSYLGKVVAILRCFENGRLVVSLNEIVRQTELPKSTAYRIADQMTDLEILEHISSGYVLGVRAMLLGQRTPMICELRDFGMAYLVDLYEYSHGNVRLSILHGPDLVELVVISGRRSSNIRSSGGIMRACSHCTASGKVLLAYAGRAAVESTLAEPLSKRTKYTITDPELLQRELACIRDRGFAVNNQENRLGVVGVAAPVFDDCDASIGAGHNAIAAVSVTSEARVAVRATAERLIAVASTIARERLRNR